MKTKSISTNNQQSGFVVVTILITMTLLSVMIAFITTQSITNYQLASGEQNRLNATFAADAGLDIGLLELSGDSDWAGTVSEVTLETNSTYKSTYQVEVSAGSTATRKIIKSTGRTYKPASATTPKSTRIFELEAEAISPSSLSVVTGVGGLVMSNSSKITGGSVFVNGNITMSNSAQIGLSGTPTSVYSAHQNCPSPADASYPRVCAAGENGQPISISNTAWIYADVYATNQTNGASMSSGGLVPSSTASPQALPSHDRDAQKAAVTTTITGSSAGCSNNQTRTWNANTKITGDVTVKNNCIVTINGDVWITGKLELENSARIVVNNSAGATRPSVMIDSQNGFSMKNSTQIQANSSGTGIYVYTYWSDSSCSPDCATVTGSDLYDSKDTVTITLDNSGNASNTIFYARWSRVQISNSSSIGALVGQTVELKNTATVTFGTAVPGFSGPTTWVKKGYLRVYQ
jgi:hypothetical protein